MMILGLTEPMSTYYLPNIVFSQLPVYSLTSSDTVGADLA